MKLTKTKSEVKSQKSFPGLIDCTLEHKIQSTTGTMQYLGPKIPKDVWDSVLSFFKWTYDTTHSESQVRLYVNVKEATWEAWAYPQEARSGMSAREVENEDAKKQRQLFPDSEGWIYFGTVHHHCGAGAFQSGTDETNEQNQDGLHITVGNMNSKHFDLHCRFYISGNCFNPDMSKFWEVSDTVRALIPYNMLDDVARFQMGTPPEKIAFPKQWQANLIEIKSAVVVCSGSMGTTVGDESWRHRGGGSHNNSNTWNDPAWRRTQHAANDFLTWFYTTSGYKGDDVVAILKLLADCSIFEQLVDLGEEYHVKATDILLEIEHDDILEVEKGDVNPKELADKKESDSKKEKDAPATGKEWDGMME